MSSDAVSSLAKSESNAALASALLPPFAADTAASASHASTLEKAERLLDARHVDAAIAAFFRAEAAGADPDRCAAGRWMAWMLRGDFEAAWRESDAVRRRGAPDPHRFWQGEDIAGERVVLRCLHGLGDAVQFLRFVPLLASRAASLTVQVPPAFQELARSFAGIERVITWGEAAGPAPEFDVQVEVNELAYMLRIQPRDLPLARNYLRPRPQWMRAVSPRPRHAAALRVGVVWSSGEWNPSRSIDWPTFQKLFETPGCEFWNLQGGSARAHWHSLRPSTAGPLRFHDANESATSLPLLAALIAQMDVIVTVDTLAAHLAGAMNIPALVLLQYAADWRWQTQRTDSPWYPSLDLLRQPREGDWTSVVSEAMLKLQQRRARPGAVRPSARGAA